MLQDGVGMSLAARMLALHAKVWKSRTLDGAGPPVNPIVPVIPPFVGVHGFGLTGQAPENESTIP